MNPRWDSTKRFQMAPCPRPPSLRTMIPFPRAALFLVYYCCLHLFLTPTRAQITTPPKSCPLLLCTALPDGCVYGPPYAINSEGCQTNCGVPTCSDDASDATCDCSSIVVVIDPCPPPPPCAAPPDGCNYESPEFDSNGCFVGCGPLTCPCPLGPPCIEPPVGCTYLNVIDPATGCVSECDLEQLECICPIFDCAEPPPGCFYGPPTINAVTGCAENCGVLECDEEEEEGTGGVMENVLLGLGSMILGCMQFVLPNV